MKNKFRIAALMISAVVLSGLSVVGSADGESSAAAAVLYRESFDSQSISEINHDNVAWTTMSGAEALGFITKSGEVSISAPTNANVIMQMTAPLRGDTYEISYNLYVNGNDGTAAMGISEVVTASDANITNTLVFNSSSQRFTVSGSVLKAADGSEATYENVQGAASFKENPVRVSMNIDFPNRKYSVSIKGAVGTVFYGSADFPYEGLGTVHWICGNRVYIGSMSIVKKRFCVTEATAGDGCVDIKFSDGVSEPEGKSGFALTSAYDKETYTVTGVKRISVDTIRLTYSGKLKKGCEYIVEVPAALTSETGSGISLNKAYFVTPISGGLIQKTLYSEDFASYTSGVPEAKDGVSWGSINPANVRNVSDIISRNNISFNSSGVSWITFDKTLEKAKYTIGFDINFWDTTQVIIKYSENVLNSDSGIYGFYANPDNKAVGYFMHTDTESGTYTKDYLTDSEGINATAENVFRGVAGDKKFAAHHINLIFDFKSEKITYELTAYDGTVYSGTTGFSMSRIKSICFSSSDRIAISNLKLEGEVEEAAPGVENIRFNDYYGETVYPEAEISSLCNELKVKFRTPMDKEILDNSVSLTRNGSEIERTSALSEDKTVYTMSLNGYLFGNSEYTLRLPDEVADANGNIIPIFSYSFKTKDGEFVFKKEFRTEKKKAELVAGDSVELYGIVIDTTGKGRGAVLSEAAFNGDKLSAYDYMLLRIPDGNTYADGTISVGITDLNNLSVKGMLWESFDSLIRLEKATVLE